MVLLILAGITINLLFSNGGIFDVASQAKVEHEIGALKDRINNVIADWSIGRTVDETVTVENLWNKMVDADIIDNPDEDIAGPEKEGENDRYELTTNEGYIVEIIISPDGNVSIGDVVKGDKLPPKIGEITSTSNSNSIHIEVEITRSEGEVRLSYYYKKDGELESSYQKLKEGVTELTADFTGLEQQEVYNIKVVVEDDNGTADKVINVTTGELTGVVNQKGETAWNNGTATIELETTETGVTIQYQVGGTEGEWLDYEGPISGLNHGDTVFAVVTDGNNQSGYSSIDILDQTNPQQAQIELSGTSSTTAGSITATVTHIDNESGIDIGNCKWEYNTNPNTIGTEESSYSNTFSDSQPITLSVATPGTYYLHVLTQDKAGNKLESISQGITVTSQTIEAILKDGDYVNYIDVTGTTRKCVVLYDSSSSYGIELITMSKVESVTLGGSNFSTASTSYNNAISTLNTKANAYNNSTYSTRARCVGSVPNNPDSQSGTSTYYGYTLRNTDTNYVTDREKMEELKIRNIGENYWLASRELYVSNDAYSLMIYADDGEPGTLTYTIGGINSSGESDGYSYTIALRPVFHLKSGLKVTGGNGSPSTPYTLGT